MWHPYQFLLHVRFPNHVDVIIAPAGCPESFLDPMCMCTLTILYTCVSGVYMCVCLLISYVVKQWPTYVGQVKISAHVVIKFGLVNI